MQHDTLLNRIALGIMVTIIYVAAFVIQYWPWLLIGGVVALVVWKTTRGAK